MEVWSGCSHSQLGIGYHVADGVLFSNMNLWSTLIRFVA
jgi:hypothetical protein